LGCTINERKLDVMTLLCWRVSDSFLKVSNWVGEHAVSEVSIHVLSVSALGFD
jgi:hypothetical protein